MNTPMSKRIGAVRVYIEEDYDGMSERAAGIFREAMESGKSRVFGFATGSTPVGMYRRLAALGLDFSGITAFNLDEYYPIKGDDEQSYKRFMRENLFGMVNIPPENLHIPDGSAVDPLAECAGYEAAIEAAGGIGFQVLGIGENGHIGFNEPDDGFPPATHMVALSDSTVKANSRFFASPLDVPRNALTMGIGTIVRCGKVMLLANGPNKARAVRDMLLGPVTPRVPASVLQLHGNAVVVMDKEAAKLL
ncbi:MAG: glucosamine-6-phosphate deaminase [Firmicutes bacterium]|nr:glucosamine-6-phosphate deaminase [Bacillota bacterium]